MMYRSKLAVFLSTLLLSFSALAFDEERAINNIAHDFAICSAYFTIISGMPQLPAKDKENYTEAGFAMYAASIALTNKNAATARLEMAVKEMLTTLDGKAENWSVLIHSYLDKCKQLSENPDARMAYWLEQE